MPGLAESQRLTADQFRERQFTWLGHLEAFKAELLKEHQVLLESVRGKGCRWIPPHEQTGVAVRDFERDARRVFRTTGQKQIGRAAGRERMCKCVVMSGVALYF